MGIFCQNYFPKIVNETSKHLTRCEKYLFWPLPPPPGIGRENFLHLFPCLIYGIKTKKRENFKISRGERFSVRPKYIPLYKDDIFLFKADEEEKAEPTVTYAQVSQQATSDLA